MQRFHLALPLLIGINFSAAAFGDELHDSIESIRRTHGISATAYFIVSASSIEVLETLGTTRSNNKIPFTPDHLVRIGSITKTFTALAATILDERNVLPLNSSVADILPEPPFLNPWSDEHPVRVVHLLEHTAGLRDLSKREFDFNRPISLGAAFQIDPDSRHLAWPPGLHSSYSNSGAGILSGVIEHVTGQTYEAFVDVEIFTTLGMSSARFTLSDSERRRLIAGYDSNGRTPIKYWHTLYPAFGGISVTPPDMVPFVQLFLNHGQHGTKRLVSRAAIERMRTPKTTLAARAGLDYGYGLGIYQYQRRGTSFFGHGGDADGYLAFFAFSPALGTGYFVVINAFNNGALRQMRRAIEDKITGHEDRKPPALASLMNDQLQELVGTYRQVTARFGVPSEANDIKISVTPDGEIYTSTRNGRRRALLPVTASHFRRKGQTVPSIAFIACGDQLYLQGDFGNYVKRVEDDKLAPCLSPPTQ